jgi:hypothetical protein
MTPTSINPAQIAWDEYATMMRRALETGAFEDAFAAGQAHQRFYRVFVEDDVQGQTNVVVACAGEAAHG